MTPSDYAAWYAALVATLVLIWDAVKWKREGPRVKGEARASWKSIGIAETEGKTITSVKVTNVGNLPTTLTSWGIYWQPPGVSKRDRKNWKAFVVKSGVAELGQVPHMLPPGEVWQGIVTEDDEYRTMLAQGGTMYVALGFSHAEEELLLKVKLSASAGVQSKPASERG